MSDKQRRKPEAFNLDEKPAAKPNGTARAKQKKARKPLVIETPPPAEPALPVAMPAPAKRRGLPFLKFLLAGLGGLISIAISLWAWRLIEQLFSRADWLGYTAIGLAALAIIGFLGILLSEMAAFFRLGKITRLRDEAAAATATNDKRAAIDAARSIIALYEARPDMARARAGAAAHLAEIIDGRDMILLVERDLLVGPDAQARALLRASAKRVSMVTAVSPRAIVDLAFVAFEVVRLSRRIAEIYGGRPSGLAFLSLLKRIGAHLTVTGGLALSDAVVQQLIGQGLAARLSARLGEGLFNGMMTARVGLAAIEVCRPMPFAGLKPPGISDLVKELATGTKSPNAERTDGADGDKP